ncbi:MAG: hypothetical protein M3Y50_18755 [Acidobacteriota bacterium]|nr:hypothetical protein [Acidobacteriota bacterium]
MAGHARIRHSYRLLALVWVVSLPAWLAAQKPLDLSNLDLRNKEGLRLAIAEDDTQPVLRVTLPGDSVPAIEVLFPEHVTARKRGDAESEHLYLFQPGRHGAAPVWRRSADSLAYERDLPEGVHLLARATLAPDGVLFHYEIENRSDVDYDMISAITDPRMTGIFHDVRLERTYVHRRNGFGLLAADMPGRLTMPLGQWLPLRFMDSYTWAVPSRLVERRADGITYYNASELADLPLIATLSSDGRWVAASFTRTTGNVWSNPELTCQHVDPARPLPAKGTATWDVKFLIFRGGLDQVLEKVRVQRALLQ